MKARILDHRIYQLEQMIQKLQVKLDEFKAKKAKLLLEQNNKEPS